MPTYEYKCTDCEYKFDAWQSIKDEPLTECPECSGKVQRLISKNVNIAFKGGGFYVTDSKKETKPTAAPVKSTPKTIEKKL